MDQYWTKIRVRSLLLNLVWGNIKSGLDITKSKLNKKNVPFSSTLLSEPWGCGEEEKEKNAMNALLAFIQNKRCK